MATDPLREAIEREVLLYCSCPGTCCCAATVNDVYAAVSPLLAAERERREAAERDTARLDWLQAHELASVSPDHDKHGVLCGWDVEWTDDVGREWLYTGRTIREAIDAALAASDEAGSY